MLHLKLLAIKSKSLLVNFTLSNPIVFLLYFFTRDKTIHSINLIIKTSNIKQSALNIKVKGIMDIKNVFAADLSNSIFHHIEPEEAYARGEVFFQ